VIEAHVELDCRNRLGEGEFHPAHDSSISRAVFDAIG
jgi:hypothetical protein